jgi:hypothetical protein
MAAGAAALMAACLLAGTAQAGSLQSCSSEPSLDAGAQSVLLRASLALKSELERHGQGVALIARSGLALHARDPPQRPPSARRRKATP